jgi:hypothetical protein
MTNSKINAAAGALRAELLWILSGEVAMPLDEKEYILFCDESVKEGKFYSNFYGGVLVPASAYEAASRRLNGTKLRLHFMGEVKWQKVTSNYLSKYMELMDAFFEELREGRAKVRIMFRQNARKPTNLTPEHHEQGFYMLYYQFIKHAFGFAHMPEHAAPVRLRVYLDQFPDTGEKVAQFRGFILGLNQSWSFRNKRMRIYEQDLTEVRSHDHVHLQCLDIVLGAMAFRLNDMHKEKPPGLRTRGSRTIAKEKLYKHILMRIRELRPNFNCGITTGGSKEDRWNHAHCHWAFLPANHEYESTMTKRGQK